MMDSTFPPTTPQWLPSQLDMVKAETLARRQWVQQNRHVRLTQRLRPVLPRRDWLLTCSLVAVAFAVGAALTALVLA